MLILCDELYATPASLRHRSRLLIHYVEEQCDSGVGREGAYFPLTRVSHSHLLVGNARAFYVERYARADTSRH